MEKQTGDLGSETCFIMQPLMRSDTVTDALGWFYVFVSKFKKEKKNGVFSNCPQRVKGGNMDACLCCSLLWYVSLPDFFPTAWKSDTRFFFFFLHVLLDRSLSFTQLSDTVLQRLKPVVCLKLGQAARSDQKLNRLWLHFLALKQNIWS